jgi:plasmid stabilization system protein ParE
MRVIYTVEALENLDEILTFIASNYPSAYEAFQSRLQSVINRISAWPDSAQEVAERPGVRVVPLIRYPYKVFYRNTGHAIEILYIHYAARDAP